MVIGARTAAWSGAALPYDAEVEYLQGDGSAYIDSGIEAKSSLSIKTRMTQTNGDWYFGALYNGLRFHHCLNSTWINSSTSLSTQAPGSTSVYTDYELVSENGDGYVKTAYLTYGSTVHFTIDTYSLGVNFILFAMNLRGTISYFTKSKVAYYQMKDNGAMVRDFIPVRAGQVGYMYDRVSGQLFGNAGTGAFVVGPDVSAANGGGYKLIWLSRVYTASCAPSSRFCSRPLWKEAA